MVFPERLGCVARRVRPKEPLYKSDKRRFKKSFTSPESGVNFCAFGCYLVRLFMFLWYRLGVFVGVSFCTSVCALCLFFSLSVFFFERQSHCLFFYAILL